MIDDTDQILNDLLARWHHWSVTTPPDTGFPAENPTCRLYRVSRQYDSDNGASDTDAETRILNAVDHCIDRIEQPHRTAVQVNARNLATGYAVWRSPRLPAEPIKLAQLLADARAMLLIELRMAGVM